MEYGWRNGWSAALMKEIGKHSKHRESAIYDNKRNVKHFEH
jgi:hypothetical protein